MQISIPMRVELIARLTNINPHTGKAYCKYCKYLNPYGKNLSQGLQSPYPIWELFIAKVTNIFPHAKEERNTIFNTQVW